MAHEAFRNFGKFVIDFVHFPVITQDEVRKRLVFDQWVELDEVMASKRGAIIVTMHFGVVRPGRCRAWRVRLSERSPSAESFGYHRMDELIPTRRARSWA